MFKILFFNIWKSYSYIRNWYEFQILENDIQILENEF